MINMDNEDVKAFQKSTSVSSKTNPLEIKSKKNKRMSVPSRGHSFNMNAPPSLMGM